MSSSIFSEKKKKKKKIRVSPAVAVISALRVKILWVAHLELKQNELELQNTRAQLFKASLA